MTGSPRIALLAVGTRGDVQPLLALAVVLRSTRPHSVVTLVTHAAHQGWVQAPAEAAGVALSLLSALPARVWATSAPQAGKRKQPERGDSSGSSDAHAAHADDAAAAHADGLREELAAASEAALGCALPARSGSVRGAALPADSTSRLLIFNLFALEGFHLAEALAVPCLAVSPCLVPYALPAAFERRFAAAHQALYSRLLAADEQPQGSTSGTAVAAASVGWQDVRHWLWPLFAEHWGAWRHHRLGLPAVPYDNCPVSALLPPPPPLLYLVSEAVVPRPGWWPLSAHMCGFASGVRCFGEEQQLPTHVLALLAAEAAAKQAAAGAPPSAAARAETPAEAAPVRVRPGPICIDFGSMGAMGLLPRPHLLAAVLHCAARLLRRRVLLLTGGWQPLAEACQQLERQQKQKQKQQQQQQQQQQSGQQAQSDLPWLTALEQPVPHAALLPRCAVLLHHGGAGTTAAALRAGIPQLVCPLHFDQQQWAERVEWLGCGAQISAAALRQAADGDDGAEGGSEQPVEQAAQALAASLQALLHSCSVAAQCVRVQQQLASEDGAAAAAQLAWQHLEQQQQQAAGASGGQPSDEPASNAQPGSDPALWPPALEVQLPGGLTVQCHSPSEAAFIHREIFVHDCYLSRGIRLPPGSTVVDAGANIGLFVLRVLRDPALGSQVARFLAFEPLPPTADMLEANLQAHGLADRVTLLRCGLHSAPGTLPFTFYPAMPGNSTAMPHEKWQHQRPAMVASMGAAAAERRFQGAARVECPVTTLALFAQEHRLERIDLLKVDVEGAELEVLRGLEGAWGLVRQAVIEVHDVDGLLAAATRLLEMHGFAVHAEPAAEGPAGNWLLYSWKLDESDD